MKKKVIAVFLAMLVLCTACQNKKESGISVEKAKETTTIHKIITEETTTQETTTQETTAQETTAQETTTEQTTTQETTAQKTTTEQTTTQEITTQSMAERNEGDSVSVLFAGDICLEEDGFVIDHFDDVGEDLTACMSPYLLKRMADADIFMLNHEYTISERGTKLDKYYTFRAKPYRMDILKRMSVDIVSLANNHIYDYGHEAFVDTINLLQQSGIKYVGAGANAEEAERIEYFEINGIKIGIVAASRAEKYVITPQATDTQEGVFWMYDHTRLKEVAAEANSKCDYLIAYLHWGTENSEWFEDYQHDIAVELEKCGVDAIIGGHSHRIQGMEYIKDMPVLYSLGDFWFNGRDKYSMMVELKIYKDGSCAVEVIPCRQVNYTIQYIEDEVKQKEFYDYMTKISSGVKFG